MRVRVYAGLGVGSLLLASAIGCNADWGNRIVDETVTLYIAESGTGEPLEIATVEVADGAEYDEGEHRSYDQFIEAEANLGLVASGVTNDQGEVDVRFERPEDLPLRGPLAVRVTSSSDVTEAFAVGLIGGTTTVGTTVTVMVIDDEITTDAYFSWDAFGTRRYIP